MLPFEAAPDSRLGVEKRGGENAAALRRGRWNTEGGTYEES
jgi:hypothetical protein